MTTDNTQAELDEIVERIRRGMHRELGGTSPHLEAGYTRAKAKQAITSLIKELVAEAKPGTWVDPEDTDDLEWQGYVKGVDDFEQNILKALEEV